MTGLGVLICGFSAGMFDYSMFGMDPFQVFAHGAWMKTPLSYGTFYLLLSLVMLVLVFFMDKRKIGIATFINLLFLGYVVDFSSKLWGRWFPEPGTAFRFGILLLAIILMCLGSALYYVGDLGVSVYDAVAITVSEKKKWDFRIVRIVCDVICTLTGFLLGATVGIGTLITAFCMGPLIAFFKRTVAIPMLEGRRPAAGKR